MKTKLTPFIDSPHGTLYVRVPDRGRWWTLYGRGCLFFGILWRENAAGYRTGIRLAWDIAKSVHP